MTSLPRRLLVMAVAALAVACGQQPSRPASSLPDQVIRNVPGERSGRVAGEPLPLPVVKAPLHDEMPPIPIEYANVLDRIRAGSRLPLVRHPWVDAELNWYARNMDYMERVFARAQRYLHHIANEVEARGLPMEIALLPIVESAFNPFAYSRSHASGLWQFIPGTGKRFGLRQDWWQDQRRDVLESTRAALEYLTYLNEAFDGDWFLAIAAYNYGGGNLRRSMRRNAALGRDTDFFSLSLPRETRAYVPKLLALSRLLQDPDAHGIVLPYIADAAYFSVIETGGPVDLRLAAELAGIEAEELHALNPGWNQWITAPDGPHRLLVPAVVAERFEQRFAALGPADRARLTTYKVAAGDTLHRIANQHKVPVYFLQTVNGTDGSRLGIGDELLVPAADVGPLRAGLVRSATSVHVVRRGDTLWDISRKYGMSVNELARANGINPKRTLRPGQRLAVRPPASGAAPVRVAGAGDTRQVRYRVRRGDTLSGIARRFDVSVRQLQGWNSLGGSTYIRAGQQLTIHVDASRDFGG